MERADDVREQIMRKVANLNLNIEAIHTSVDVLANNLRTIEFDLGGIIGKNMDAADSQPSQRQYQQGQELGPNAIQQSTGFVESPAVAIPAAVVARKLPDVHEVACQKSASHSGRLKSAKRVRWFSRWQDLFDGKEAEHDDIEEVIPTRSRPIGNYKRGISSFKIIPTQLGTCMMHPHCMFRVVWDALGLLILVIDTILIPINFAWAFEMNGLGRVFQVTGTVYWIIDIALFFNTGILTETSFILSRAAVALRYLRTWLCIDIFLVLLDLTMLLSPSLSDANLLRTVRVVRLVRLARGLRLLKLSKLFLAIEFAVNIYGGTVAVMTIAIVKTLGSIYILAHLAACVWYFIGREHGKSQDSWLDLANFGDAAFHDQYIRSCYWVVGHLIAAPVDPTISPQNFVERSFTLSMIISSLLVLGIAISKMSDTVTNLQRANAEARDAKRKLESYLHSNKFSTKTIARIVRHALSVYKKRSRLNLDPFTLGLLSTAHVSEINAWQRSSYLQQHPLFVLICEYHPQAIYGIYDAFAFAIYAESEAVYEVATLSEFLYITTSGAFVLHEFPRGLHNSCNVTVYERIAFFCEVSLFAHYRHQSTLTVMTFADCLRISGVDFAQCIRHVPSCISTMYRYARCYLNNLFEVQPSDSAELLDDEIAVQDVMPRSLAEEACKVARGSHLPSLTEITSSSVEDKIVHDAINCILDQDLSAEQIVEQLEFAFPEVQEVHGLYAHMAEPLERKRSLGAMLGLIWLRKDAYHSFTESQDKESRMTNQLWGEWQRVVQWTDMSRETLHALLFLLGIRGLGKAKALLKMIPKQWRSPEDTVLYLLSYAPKAVPSVTHLSNEQLDLVKKVLETHKAFNLAQLMQGENTPYQVMSLKACVEAEGETLLKFYLLFLVGMMCGLTGDVSTRGCLFMNENNARNVLLCIECLQRLDTADPRAVYWSYLSRRGQFLDLRVNSLEDLTIARLACLIRASKADCSMLQETWSMLDACDKDILVEHMIADGINERAFLFRFLPVYLANAHSNRAVGLHRGLQILVDLISLLQSDGIVNNISEYMIVVNISDIASFIKEAINTLAVESLVRHVNIIAANEEFRISVGVKHWQASSSEDWRPDPIHDIAHGVNRMTRMARSLLSCHQGRHVKGSLRQRGVTKSPTRKMSVSSEGRRIFAL